MPLPEINRPKLLVLLSFLLSLPAGYYFVAGDVIEAVIFMLISDVSDRVAMRLQAINKEEGWKPAIKTAIDRCADAAIFVGFALSGIVPDDYGIALLAAAILLPLWIKAFWKKDMRWVFHALVYLSVVLYI